MGVTYNNRIVTDGLVLCLDAASKRSYPGTGTTWTDLVGSNNGTLVNGPTFDSSNAGNIVFDGTDDYINMGDILSAPSSLSIFSWVNCDVFVEFPIVIKGIGAVGTREYGLFIFSGVVRGYVADESAGDVDYVDGATSLSTGSWFNVGMTWTGSTLSVYLNGSLDNSTSTSVSEIENLSSPLTIGKDTSPDYANGKISNVSIYNRALTADEVRQNYLSTKERYL